MVIPKMSCFRVLSLLLITVVLSTSGHLKCGMNEVLDDCPSDCAYDHCPKHEVHNPTRCPKPTVCPPPRCKCAFDHKRADNNTCINTRDCPPFKCTKSNEVYDSCPPLCPSERCQDATPTGECPFFMLFVLECNPDCRCIPGHWRDEGVCVPYHECPNIKKQLEDQGVISASYGSK